MSTTIAPAPAPVVQAPQTLMRVEGLEVTFVGSSLFVPVVRGVSWELARGESLGVLGESGSGKSVMVKSLMGLLPKGKARVEAQRAELLGTDLLSLRDRARRDTMGQKMSIVFQDALSALNPVHPIGKQISEMYRVHWGYSRSQAREAAIEMMRRVRIPAPEQRVKDFPHQFSGGMRQRICIAIALALDPDVVIADEPTTALDVTVQAQILDLLHTEQRERGMGLILISHDISVISEMTDRVVVMYAGQVIESGPTHQVLRNPAHPYTQGLSASSAGGAPGERMPAISGAPPNMARLPAGCSFAPRCPMAQEVCTQEAPPCRMLPDGRMAACHFVEGDIA